MHRLLKAPTSFKAMACFNFFIVRINGLVTIVGQNLSTVGAKEALISVKNFSESGITIYFSIYVKYALNKIHRSLFKVSKHSDVST